MYLWTRRCWRIYHLEKYNSRCLVRQWHLVTDLEDSKSTSGGVLCVLLDVQEAKFCLAQVYRIWDYFSGCWITYGWVTCSRSLGHSEWSSTFDQQQWPTIMASRKLVQISIPKLRRQKVDQLSDVDYVPTNKHLSCTFLKTAKPWSIWWVKDEVRRWDTCPELTKSLLIGWLTESIWNPRSKSNMWTPKTNSQTFWLKEVFHETNGIIFFVWSTLWVSRCPRAAISVIFFLTIRLESRAPCQNKVKRRPRTKALRWRKRDHAWWHVTRGVRKSLHDVWGIWSIWGIPMKEKTWKQPLETVGDSLQDQKSGTLKRVDKRMLQWPLETAGGRSNSKHTVMREHVLTPVAHFTCAGCVNTRTSEHWIHEPSIHEQDLSVPAKEVGNVSMQLNFLDASTQNKCIDMENVHASCAELFDEYRDLQEHQIRGDWKFVQYYSEVGNRTFWRDSECKVLGVFITVLDEISIISWSSDQMGEGKSVGLCRFRSMSGTDERQQRSESKIGRSSGRTQVVSVLPRSSGNRWRSNWIRVDNFPQGIVIGCSSRDPKRLDEKEHSTRRVQGPDHLHVNVQWHCMERKWWELCFNAQRVKNHA